MYKPFVPLFAVWPREHAARVDAAIARVYAQGEESAPTVECPIAPLHRLLEACALNVCELESLSKRRLMQWLLDGGGLRRAWREESDFDEPIAGFLYANAAGGCVFVEATNPISRRRFSAAHEMGHYLLHFEPNLANSSQQRAQEIEWIEPTSPASTCRDQTQSHNIAAQLDYAHSESEADAFAAELLMPHDLIDQRAAQLRAAWGDADLVWRMSQEFLVSRKAMWVRLRHRGWIDGALNYESIEGLV